MRRKVLINVIILTLLLLALVMNVSAQTAPPSVSTGPGAPRPRAALTRPLSPRM